MNKFDQINKVECFFFGMIFSFVGIGLFLGCTDQRMFEHVYVLEDGLVEWSTVILLLVLTVSAWARLFKNWGRKKLWFNFCLFFLGILGIFGAGEEISWGQRIFRWLPPEYFYHNNTQQETTLHNLVIGGVRINKVIFGTGLGIFMGFYLLIIPIIYERLQKLKKFIDGSAIPVAQIHQILFFILIFVMVSLIPSGKRGELYEFSSVFLSLLIFLFPQNKKIYH